MMKGIHIVNLKKKKKKYQLLFENREIKKTKVKPPVGFEHTNPRFEATEHLRNRMCQENC